MNKRPFRSLTLAAFFAGCLLRLAHWGAPVTADEGYTLSHYAGRPISDIISTYDAPNNHVLLSVILHSIDSLWPKELILTAADPRPLQVPSLLGAMGCLWLVGVVGAAMAGPLVGFFAVVSLSVSYWHLMYSHMLRAYSLSAFVNLLNLWLAFKALRGQRRALWVIPATLAAAHWLVPTNAAYTTASAVAVGILWARRPGPTGKGRARAAPSAATLTPLLAAAAAGVVLTGFTYRPIFAQLVRAAGDPLSWTRTFGMLPMRLSYILAVLGNGWTDIAGWAALSAYGFWSSWQGGRRRRLCALVALCLIAVPVAFFTLQGVIPPTRIYTSALPFVAIMVGLALERMVLFATSFFGWGRRRIPLIAGGLAIAVAAADSPALAAFLRWNRGVDPRLALGAVIPLIRDTDDFVLIAVEPVENRHDFDMGGDLNWDYYGVAMFLLPSIHLTVGRDAAYLARATYIVLAPNEAAARQSLTASGVDEMLQGGLRRYGESGSLGIFKTTCDGKVIALYRAAAADSAAPAAARAHALTGLGTDALQRGDYEEARIDLERAKGILPSDEKIRYQLGLAHYFAFDDTRAEGEFQWVVAHNPENYRAAFYLGETLSQLGRFEEALRWYGAVDERYLFANMASVGVEAIKTGAARVRPPALTAAGWQAVSDQERHKGAIERSAVAQRKAVRLEPTAQRRFRLATIYSELDEHAEAAKILEALIHERGSDSDIHAALAYELRCKNDFDGARQEVDVALKLKPDHRMAGELAAELSLLRQGYQMTPILPPVDSRLHGTTRKSSRAAAAEDLAAQQAVTRSYLRSQRKEEGAQALKMLRDSAERGDLEAQINLGAWYFNGTGGRKDLSEAIKWFRKAADQRNSLAQYNLGAIYFEGIGVARDLPEAIKWFRKAAEQGETHAQFNLGGCYAQGIGVPQDIAEAKKWLSLAAEGGNIQAREVLKHFGNQ